MKHAIELVVFDMSEPKKDYGEVTKTFAKTFQPKGYAIPNEKIAEVMGYKKTDAIRSLLERFAEDKSVINDDYINEMHEYFIDSLIDYYKNSDEVESTPFAEEAFEFLKKNNVRIGLDTGFFSDITSVIVERLGWLKDGLVDFVISSDEVPEGRPQPFMIQELMKRANVTDSNKVIKIGDTEVDIKEGRNAGCLLTIAVTTGSSYSREQLELYQPDFIIDSLEELPELL